MWIRIRSLAGARRVVSEGLSEETLEGGDKESLDISRASICRKRFPRRGNNKYKS